MLNRSAAGRLSDWGGCCYAVAVRCNWVSTPAIRSAAISVSATARSRSVKTSRSSTGPVCVAYAMARITDWRASRVAIAASINLSDCLAATPLQTSARRFSSFSCPSLVICLDPLAYLTQPNVFSGLAHTAVRGTLSLFRGFAVDRAGVLSKRSSALRRVLLFPSNSESSDSVLLLYLARFLVARSLRYLLGLP